MPRLVRPGRWVEEALAWVPPPDAPGDCFYVPPACLLDMDATDRAAARRWRLAIGRLRTPDSGGRFIHCWLELGDAVVSVSNLRNGYPPYANDRERYYALNDVRDTPARISARGLRARALRWGLGPTLARWLASNGTTTAVSALADEDVA
jgi:hypothetical protein